MADDNKIEVPIEVDISQAESSLSKLSGILASAAAAIGAFAAGKALIHFLEESVAQASEAQDAISSLNFAMAQTGEFSTDAASSMKAFANNLADLSTFSDTAVTKSLALAKNFGLTNEKAQELVQTAANLAAVQKTDLTSATDKLLLSLNGQARGLKELGAEFGQLTEAQARAGGALDLINKKFGDASLIASFTFSGAIQRAKNQIEQLQESVGTFATESASITAGIRAFGDAIGLLTKKIEDNEDAQKQFGDLISLVSTGIGGAILIVARFVESILLLPVAIEKVVRVFTSAIPAVLGLFGELEIKIRKALGATEAELKDVREETDGFFDSAKSLVRGPLTDFNEKAFSAANGVETLGQGLNTAVKALGNTQSVTAKQTDLFDRLNKQAQETGKQFGKLSEEANKFSQELLKNSQTDFEKAGTLRREELNKLKEFFDQGALSSAKAAQDRILIETAYQKKVHDIREKERKEAQDAIDAANKFFEESLAARKKAIEDAFKDPVTAIINFDKDLPDAGKLGAAVGLGIVSSMLEGAKGAQKLLKAGVKAGVDFIAPGFGDAFATIFDQFATLGPEGTKQMVREFIDAIPEILDKVAESIPAFVEALIDSLINKGGAFRIGVAIARSFGESVAESGLRSIGKQIGADIVKSLQGVAVFVGFTMANVFSSTALAAFALLPPQIRQSIADGATEFAQKVLTVVPEFGSGLANAFISAFSGFNFGNFTKAFSDGALAFIDGIIGVFGDLTASFSSSALSSISTAGDIFVGDIIEAFNIVRRLGLSSFADIHIDTAGIADAVRNGISGIGDIIKDAIGSVVPGGGSSGGFRIPNLSDVPHLAKGGTIPSGFSNDNFLFNGKTGERIIPDNINSKLEAFLEKGGSDNTELMTALLGKILTAVSQPQQVTSQVQINNRTFADIILSLSRSNARLTA